MRRLSEESLYSLSPFGMSRCTQCTGYWLTTRVQIEYATSGHPKPRNLCMTFPSRFLPSHTLKHQLSRFHHVSTGPLLLAHARPSAPISLGPCIRRCRTGFVVSRPSFMVPTKLTHRASSQSSNAVPRRIIIVPSPINSTLLASLSTSLLVPPFAAQPVRESKQAPPSVESPRPPSNPTSQSSGFNPLPLRFPPTARHRRVEPHQNLQRRLR